MQEASQHLEPEQVAAYLDRRVTPEERERIEAHLAECAHCRAEIVAVSRLLAAPARSPRRFPLAPAAAVAAAAVLAALLLFRAGDVLPPTQPETERATEARVDAEGLPLVPVSAPRQGAVVSPDELRFVWSSLGDEILYRFTLADPTGSVVWTQGTTGTELELPADVELAPGTTYFWHVDALLDDGRAASSRVHSFTTR